MKRWLGNIVLLFVTLLLLYGFGEVVVRALRLQSDKIISLDSCVGFKDKPNIKTVLGGPGGFVEISTNSAGYRDVEHTVAKNPNIFRMLFLGDSFTEALQVPFGRTFWRELITKYEKEGKDVEIISMGTSSYGNNQELLTYTCYGRAYAPDLVVLNFYNGNDLVDNYFRRDAFSPQFDLSSSSTLVLDESYKARIALQTKRHTSLPYGPLFWLKDNSKLAQYLFDRVQLVRGERKLGAVVSDTNPIYLKEYPTEWQKAWDLTDALVGKLADEVAADKAAFVLVSIPGLEELEPERVENKEKYDTGKVESYLRTFAEEKHITFVPLFPALSEAHKTGAVHFDGDIHWNERGHEVVAGVLHSALRPFLPY